MTPVAPRRILIVDDSAAVRDALELLLEPFGFEVEHAEDGAAALRRCGSGRFDLVLLDLHMPVLDGPTTLRFLRQWGNRTPVVLVTAASDTKLLSSVIKLGNADYVCKPFDPRQIHAALARSLGVPPGELVAEPARALVVDAGEASAELLRGAAPPHVAVDVAGPEGAEALARQRAYRLVLLDGVSGGRAAADALGRRLKALQPEAALLLLDEPGRVTEAGRRLATDPFDGAVARPPAAQLVQEFLYPVCLRPLVRAHGETVALTSFRGHEADAGVYFELAGRRIQAAIHTALQEATDLTVDLSRAPPDVGRLGRLMTGILTDTAELEVDPVFVVTPAVKAGLTADGELWPAPIVTPGERP